MTQELNDAYHTLGVLERAVLRLYMKGLEDVDIAEAVGIPEAEVADIVDKLDRMGFLL